jgi:hypothetical protein
MMEAIHSSEISVLREPYSVTPQKVAFVIVTAMKTSNLTKCVEFGLDAVSLNKFPHLPVNQKYG